MTKTQKRVQMVNNTKVEGNALCENFLCCFFSPQPTFGYIISISYAYLLSLYNPDLQHLMTFIIHKNLDNKFDHFPVKNCNTPLIAFLRRPMTFITKFLHILRFILL